MKRTIKNYCLNATQKKIAELYEIARRYSSVKNEVFQKYGSLSGLKYLDYPRRIRDEWVKTDYPKKFGLQARYWKQAFEEAWANIKTNWSLCFIEARRAIYYSQNLAEDEKRYCYYLLKSPSLLYQAITFQPFKLPASITKLKVRPKVNKWLKGRVRRYQRKKPYPKKKTSFVLDTDMYNYFTDSWGRLWMGVMGLEKRKRLHLPLAGSVKFRGNLIEFKSYLNTVQVAVVNPAFSSQSLLILWQGARCGLQRFFESSGKTK